VSRKILFVASNPSDTPPLRLDKEVREIEEGLRRSNEREQFDLVKLSAARIEDLRRSLLDHSPQFVHFAGHGDGTDGIVLEDCHGQTQQVPNDALADLFRLCSDHLECVILNACYSDVQATEIVKHIPYVVGMSADISDNAAIEFAVAFYDALGAGRPIEIAYQFGRNAIAMKGIPEDLTPVLKIKDLTDADKLRLTLGSVPSDHIAADVSVLSEGTESWHLGDDTIVRYSLTKEDGQIKINYRLGYAEHMDAGGPIAPLRYLSSTWCPFWWDFPTLDFKILNNSPKTLFVTEVILNVDESCPDSRPLLAIKRDVLQSCAGDLLLVNEGWCDLVDIIISFNLHPGEIPEPVVPEPPYRHSIDLPLLSDNAKIDITQAFEREGVNITGLILLTNGRWEDNKTFVVPTVEGLDEKLSTVQLEEREKIYVAAFKDHVGTLVGEIGFTVENEPTMRRTVKFYGVVYLANANRRGLPRPPTATYGAIFETAAISYQRRVQISHEVRPGETDRFGVKIAVRQSSFHTFSATIRDITGRELTLPTIQMRCFVPRSRRAFVESRLNSMPE
jgi:CHAT domain